MKSTSVSAIIPAFNEGPRIGTTVESLLTSGSVDEVIVVDDGSQDETSQQARSAGAVIVRLPRNCGKAAAARAGFARSRGDVILLLDADLETSAVAVVSLIEPILYDGFDLVIGRLPGSNRGGGIGAVKMLARWAVSREGGSHLQAPLSGQRSCRRRFLEELPSWGVGFGLEVAITIHGLRAGAKILEKDIVAYHRVTRFDLPGFQHRFRQFMHIAKTIRMLRPVSGAVYGRH